MELQYHSSQLGPLSALSVSLPMSAAGDGEAPLGLVLPEDQDAVEAAHSFWATSFVPARAGN